MAVRSQALSAGTISQSGSLTLTANGAASAPAETLTGTWFSGGSATTTKPQLLIEPTGTTTTGWSTAGTGLGINCASGFAGKYFSCQLNGLDVFNIDASTSTVTSQGTGNFAGNVLCGSAQAISVSGRGILTSTGAGVWQHGAADAASPVAQTLQVQNVVTGTSNTAGVNFTINGSQGTGTGAGGSIIFQTAAAGGSGTSQNALAAALTIDSTKASSFAGSAKFTAATAGVVLKQGANGLVGTFVANGATAVVVSNTNVAITDAIIISLNTVGGTPAGQPFLSAISAGTSFSVKAVAGDTSTYNYAIIKNAP